MSNRSMAAIASVLCRPPDYSLCTANPGFVQVGAPVVPEIWTEQFWHPTFAKQVKGYKSVITGDVSPDKLHAEVYDALMNSTEVDVRKRSRMHSVYSVYVDDVLLQFREQLKGTDAVCPLQGTLIFSHLTEPKSEWVMCICCASM